jgi:RNA polymerase sigma-70 factor, ECF subfamily
VKLFRFSNVYKGEEPEALMLRAKRGDAEAFAMLYDRFKGPVYSYLRGFSATEAEDMLHETFLKAYRAREGYEPHATFATWLWTIARNVALDYWRKHKEILDSGTEEEATREPATLEEDSADSLLIEQADRARVEKCLEALPPKQKEALLLRTVAERPYEEIAILMKVSLANVKTLLYRAKEGLTRCLEAS